MQNIHAIIETMVKDLVDIRLFFFGDLYPEKNQTLYLTISTDCIVAVINALLDTQNENRSFTLSRQQIGKVFLNLEPVLKNDLGVMPDIALMLIVLAETIVLNAVKNSLFIERDNSKYILTKNGNDVNFELQA